MGERWVSVIPKCHGVSLDIVVDHKFKSANALASQIPGCRGTEDLRSVLNDKKIDAILIATSHKYLSPVTHSALMAGKHVLCEKPGAIKSSDIKRNATLAKKKGLTYMIGYNHRFHDGFLKARKLYDRGTIGKLIFIRARYGFGGRIGYETEWRLNKAVSGGGHLIDQGVHMIDLALSFIGKVKRVSGFTSDTFWKKGVEDNAFVLIQDKGGAIASIHASLTQWKALHNFEIYGTKGYLSIEGLGTKYGESEKLVIGKRADDFIGPVKEKIVKCNPLADDSLMLELKHFSDIIRGRKKNPLISGAYISNAYEALKIVEKVYRDNKL